MIHHLSLGTDDIERARAFYDPVLAVLGVRCLAADEQGDTEGNMIGLHSQK
jgi:catechol 2,3-dioxygenase-like lactoylglutathione lyase family enzyme